MFDSVWRCVTIIRKNSRYICIGLVCIILLVLSWYYQKLNPVIEDGKIKRNEPGKGDLEYELTVDGEGINENHKYSILVEDQKLTETECQKLIDQAKEEIDNSFFADGENADHVSLNVNMKESYVGGKVSAEWFLSNYKVVDLEGNIDADTLSENGEIITAEVELTCNEIKEMYSIPFRVCPLDLSAEEQLIKDINVAITTENDKAGTEYVTLPTQVNGVDLTWNTAENHIVLKVLMLEIVGIMLIILAYRKQEQKKLKDRQDSMRIDYAEIVSKMSILLGAGMSIKESWRRISAHSSKNMQKINNRQRPVYEEMKITMREIEDGVTERIAYQNFGERVALSEYHRLIRLLISNMQKGNRSICMALEEEAVNAYEQRRLLIKKLGEEAGTKMLIPLMIMLIIVMVIILTPAILSF